ncbi:MAG: 4'-phosphopantetheinyl transferase family protein [Gemmatimonadota bacterium]
MRDDPAPPETIHVWKARLDRLNGSAPWATACLTAAEHARAARLHRPEDRRRWLLGRGVLRHVLALHTEDEPSEIILAAEGGGKPRLESSGSTASAWHFNLSHSRDALVVGVARVPLGVDVERIRPLAAPSSLARRILSSSEREVFRSLPVEHRSRALFRAWTRKEAMLKALGTGLRRPPRSVEVSLRPAAPARVLAVDGDPGRAAPWTLVEREPWPRHVAVVAVRAPVGGLLEHDVVELLG